MRKKESKHMTEYVHGYSEREALRLAEQADTLEGLLHYDTIYPPGARIPEAGCGVGAQTVILAKNNPMAEITSIDISLDSLEKARENVEGKGIENVRFCRQISFLSLSKRPELVDGFILKTIIPMVEGVKKQALEMQMIEEETWNKGIEELHETAKPTGTFCYTFFKGRGTK
jgi:SAM-dependent methyltransferase